MGRFEAGGMGVEALRPLAPVDNGRVVLLLEGVHEHLPVGGHLGPEPIARGQLVERIALHRGDHRAEELAQRLLVRRIGVVVEVHEDEPGPDIAVHRDEAVVGLVEIEELAFLLDEGAGAVESVTPAVVLAGELTRGAARLLARKVLPHQLVATVPADVVERADLISVAHDDDRRARDCDLSGEVAAVARELLDPSNVQPGPLEDGLALELEELGRDRVGVRHQASAELGVVLGPASLRRFGKPRHDELLNER